MPDFLVELYLARGGAIAAAQARRAAEQLAREGRRVRYVRSIFVPEDETCFYLYEADRVEDVEEAARRAALPYERISEAVAEPATDA